MRTAHFLDTNIFLRYLLDDHPVQSPACRQLLKRVESGQISAVTSWLVIAEIVWTLSSRYGIFQFERARVAQDLRRLLQLRHLRLADEAIADTSLSDYAATNVDFIDAYHAAWSAKEGLSIYSYDKHFDKLAVERFEPEPAESKSESRAA